MDLTQHKELIDKVEEALQSIRPFLQRDGGDVELIDVSEDHNVKIKLIGACASCTMSGMTMKNGIEQSIRQLVPQIQEIIEVAE